MGPSGSRAASAGFLILLSADVAAMALDAVEHLIGAHPLPGVEHLLEQRPPVGEVPIEPALGHAERLRQSLDPDGVRAAGRKSPQALLDPPVAGRPGNRDHGHIR